MGRSSQQKAQETRATIVVNADAMFRAQGVDQVSIADLMRSCDMTVGGFYKHFASKEALVAEVCEQAFSQASQTWVQVYARAQAKGLGRNAELVRRYIGNRAAHQLCPILAYAPQASASSTESAAATAYQAGIRRLFEQFTSASEPGGAANAQDASNEQLLLFAAMLGARMLNQAVGKTDWVQAVEAAVVNAAAAQADR